MSSVYLKGGRGWISADSQNDGRTMLHINIGRAGSHVYDLTAPECRLLAQVFADEANRQEQAKADDEKLRAALAADEVSA